MPVLSGEHDGDRQGQLGAAGCDPGAVSGDRDQASEALAGRRLGIVVQAPAPARLIEGGIPTEAMVAHVLVERYADHLPMYRQAQILGRQGVILERSTLSFWMKCAAAEVAPVVARLREMMLASTRIFADETVVPVLDPGRGRDQTGILLGDCPRRSPAGG